MLDQFSFQYGTYFLAMKFLLISGIAGVYGGTEWTLGLSEFILLTHDRQLLAVSETTFTQSKCLYCMPAKVQEGGGVINANFFKFNIKSTHACLRKF